MRRLRELVRRTCASRERVVGINRRNVELVYPNNPRVHYPMADDKLITKELCARHGVPVPETLAVCPGLFAIDATVSRLADQDHFVIKPASGSGGDGILVVGERRGPGQWARASGAHLPASALRKHLADIVFGAYTKHLSDRAYAERRVFPHAAFHGIWSEGLCDVRVITLHARPVLAMVRVPTRKSEGRANLHQGGIGLAVDRVTGEVLRARAQGRWVTHHPDSGAPLLGWRLPLWKETVDTALAAARISPLRYLGVDLVVDRERGPLVLEINARPGLEIQNVHQRGLGSCLGEPAP